MKVEASSSLPNAAAPGPGVGAGRGAAAPAFGQALSQAQGAAATRVVARGDTLVSVVRDHAAQRGLRITASQVLAQAHQLARDSAIANPDRIFPGQRLALQGLNSRLAALPAADTANSVTASAGAATEPAAQMLDRMAASASATARPARSTLALTPVTYQAPADPRFAAAPRTAPVQASDAMDAARAAPGVGAHPVLEQTLDRAVQRGFIPAIERGDVYDKILELSARHRFKPDDFARMTLMESDGMNPRATNERCHGIIQFCDGNDRGAATAGFASNPRAILGLSVYQQLHLVDKYFTEVGVKSPGNRPPGLDDLYLSVLMPAARGNTDPNAPLGIPGPQATYLHPGRDRSAPITRQSILDGLQQNASDRLASYAQRMRPQAMREELPPEQGGTRLR